MNLATAMEALQAPFPPGDEGHKVQNRTRDKSRGQVATYIDARAVAERLDLVVGPDNWSDAYDVIDVGVLRCRLTVYGVTKEGFGEADKPDEDRKDYAPPYKSAESDALKRAAVKFGIGRYLYDLEKPWVDLVDGKLPKGWKPAGRPSASAGSQRPAAPAPAAAAPPIDNEQLQAIRFRVRELGWSEERLAQLVLGVTSRRTGDPTELTSREASTVVANLGRQKPIGGAA